jgi:hypothetical protein
MNLEIIKLNVCGKYFEIPKNILIKSDLFAKIFEDGIVLPDILPIYRSPMLFEHVLAYLIDNKYPYPIELKSELDYYLIPYVGLYNPSSKIETNITNINWYLRDTRDQINKIYNNTNLLINNINLADNDIDTSNDECCYPECINDRIKSQSPACQKHKNRCSFRYTNGFVCDKECETHKAYCDMHS